MDDRELIGWAHETWGLEEHRNMSAYIIYCFMIG